MKSKRRQKGFWNFALPAIATVAGGLLGKEGQEDTNENNANINSAQMAFNREEAQLGRDFNADEALKSRIYNDQQASNNRQFQENMSNSQYRRAVADLKEAGLNPMLAYMNGGAGNVSGAQGAPAQASGGQASSGSMIAMQNSAKAGVEAAMAAAQIANTEAQTKVAEATAEKVKAEVPNVQASTAKMKAEIPKITAEIDKIVEERNVLVKEGWNKTDIGNLLRAQEQLAKVETGLKANTLTVQDAQVALTKVETTLKQLQVAGAKNLENWEKFMSDDNLGHAGKAARALAELLGTIKSLRRP